MQMSLPSPSPSPFPPLDHLPPSRQMRMQIRQHKLYPFLLFLRRGRTPTTPANQQLIHHPLHLPRRAPCPTAQIHKRVFLQFIPPLPPAGAVASAHASARAGVGTQLPHKQRCSERSGGGGLENGQAESPEMGEDGLNVRAEGRGEPFFFVLGVFFGLREGEKGKGENRPRLVVDFKEVETG